MIFKLAESITGILINNKTISQNDKDIYIYGYEILFSTLINLLILILCGLIYNMFIEVFAFFLPFYFIRKYSGGFHANTYIKCNIIFFINVFLVLSILKCNIITNFLFFNILVFAFSFLCMLLFAPVINKYKHIQANKKNTYKIKSILLLVFFECFSLLLFGFYQSISISITLSILSIAISMIINIGDCESQEK